MYWTFTRAFVKEKPFLKRREINAPLTPVRTTLGKVTGEDVEKRDPSARPVGMQIGAASGEISMEQPQKLKGEVPYNPAIPLLCLYPKKTKH